MKRKYLLAALFICLCALLCPLPAAAGSQTLSAAPPSGVEASAGAAIDWDAVRTKLSEGLGSHAERLDVASFAIPNSEENRSKLLNLVSALRYERPELFYVGTSLGYASSGGVIIALVPAYVAFDDLEGAKREYESRLDAIVAQADMSWSELEKVVWTHDYIAAHYEYDVSVFAGNVNAVRDLYGFLTQGKGVCEAYARAVIAILRELGVEASFATSEEANHAWNIVKVGGSWYHLDATFGDPLYGTQQDIAGRVSHDYLLLSTSKLLAEEPSRSDMIPSRDVLCESTVYDARGWKGCTSPLVELNDVWYGVFERRICSYNMSADFRTSILSLPEWKTGSLIWYDAYSGLGVFDGKLVYNTPDAVMGLVPGGQPEVLLTPAERTGANYIYGFSLDGPDIKYLIANAPPGAYNTFF